MAMLSRPAFGPRAALAYVTVGALACVWTAVYYFAFARGSLADDNTRWFWVVGLFLTGLTLVVIGLLLGPLGRAAREAELPPKGATRAEAQIQQAAAAAPGPVVLAAGAPGVPPAPVAAAPGVVPPPQPTA